MHPRDARPRPRRGDVFPGDRPRRGPCRRGWPDERPSSGRRPDVSTRPREAEARSARGSALRRPRPVVEVGLKHVFICVALWVTLGCVILGAAGVAGAHPAGFTSVNRYVGVQCDGDGRLHISYLVDFAELPSYAELDQLDRDHDGTLTPDEQRAYLDRRFPPLVAAWSVEIDGVRGSPRVTGSSLEVTPGERGLSTLRIAADVVVERPRDQAPGASDVVVIVQDPSFADHPGWREMSAEDSPGAVVVSGPTGRVEDALAYAPAARASPPRIDLARFAFRLRAAAPDSARGPVVAEAPVAVDARLSAWGVAMKKASGSALFSALAAGLAFALGAAHALSPGHGKTLAAAYLVGRRARSSQAFLFGATVTVSHTVVVFVVGCLALTIERTVGSEHVLRLLELGSAVAIVVLAIVQLARQVERGDPGGREHSHDATLDLAPGGVRFAAAPRGVGGSDAVPVGARHLARGDRRPSLRLRARPRFSCFRSASQRRSRSPACGSSSHDARSIARPGRRRSFAGCRSCRPRECGRSAFSCARPSCASLEEYLPARTFPYDWKSGISRRGWSLFSPKRDSFGHVERTAFGTRGVRHVCDSFSQAWSLCGRRGPPRAGRRRVPRRLRRKRGFDDLHARHGAGCEHEGARRDRVGRQRIRSHRRFDDPWRRRHRIE